MLYLCVMAAAMPPKVQEEKLPDGRRRFVLSDGFAAVEQDEEEQAPMFQGTQADFVLGADRTEAAADIEAAFDAWWDYATEWQSMEAAPTTEERLEALEEAIMAMMGG